MNILYIICTCVCLSLCLYMFVCVYICTYTHTHMQTYIFYPEVINGLQIIIAVNTLFLEQVHVLLGKQPKNIKIIQFKLGL